MTTNAQIRRAISMTKRVRDRLNSRTLDILEIDLDNAPELCDDTLIALDNLLHELNRAADDISEIIDEFHASA